MQSSMTPSTMAADAPLRFGDYVRIKEGVKGAFTSTTDLRVDHVDNLDGTALVRTYYGSKAYVMIRDLERIEPPVRIVRERVYTVVEKEVRGWPH